MKLSVFAALCALSVSPMRAQHRSSAAVGINTMDAPVPTPVLEGKRVFLSYELGDVTAFPSGYSGGPERAYSEMYAAMKAWGRYEMVLDPKDADLIFGIRFVYAPGLAAPQIRLGIADVKTHTALWGFVEQVDVALLKKHRDVDFSEAVDRLMGDVKTLLAPPLVAQAQP